MGIATVLVAMAMYPPHVVVQNAVYCTHKNRFLIFHMFISSSDDDATHHKADLLVGRQQQLN